MWWRTSPASPASTTMRPTPSARRCPSTKRARSPSSTPGRGRGCAKPYSPPGARAIPWGGVVRVIATGLPAGLGEPMFGGVENRLAAALFGIPAVRGVEFGEGFRAADLRGSGHNDAFAVENGRVVTVTNRHAGILGGITSGMPIVCAWPSSPRRPSPKSRRRSIFRPWNRFPSSSPAATIPASSPGQCPWSRQ